MNFVADEGIDAPIVHELRAHDFQVEFIAETSPGAADTVVLRIANRNNAILITSDKDFGDLIFRQKRASQGVLLLRLHGIHPDQKAKITLAAVQIHGPRMRNAFTVITPQRVRIRPRLQ